MVATISEVEVFKVAKLGIGPVPLAESPISVLLFVHS
jgi:hypothetical protein